MPPTDSPQFTPDQLRTVLDPLKVDQSVKANVWDAFHATGSQQDFQKVLDSTPLDSGAKAQLWDLRYGAPKAQTASVSAPTQNQTTAQPTGFWDSFVAGGKEGAQKFGEGAYNSLVAPFVQPYKEGYRDPISYTTALAEEMGAGFKEGQQQEQDKAHQFLNAKPSGSTTQDVLTGLEGARHAIAAAIPFYGPGANAAGQDIGEGRVAQGLGEVAALAFAPKLEEGIRSRISPPLTSLYGSNLPSYPKTFRDIAPTEAAPTPVKVASKVVEPAAEITPAQALTPEVAPVKTNVPVSPAQHIEAAGLVNKGELVKGSGVHMIEHPDFPGVTAAADASKITSPQDASNIMAGKLDAFSDKPLAGQDPTNLRATAATLRGETPEVPKESVAAPSSAEPAPPEARTAELAGKQSSPEQLAQTFQGDLERLENARRQVTDPKIQKILDDRMADIQDNLRSLGQNPVEKFQDQPNRSLESPQEQFTTATPAEPSQFPVEDFSARMDNIERLQRSLSKPISDSQRPYFSNLLDDAHRGLSEQMENFFSGAKDSTLASKELDRVRGQMDEVKEVLRQRGLISDIREGMADRYHWKTAEIEDLENPNGERVKVGETLPFEVRDAFHNAFKNRLKEVENKYPAYSRYKAGEPVELSGDLRTQYEKAGQDAFAEMQNTAKGKLSEIRDLVEKRIENMVEQNPDLATADMKDLQRRAIKDELRVNGRDLAREAGELQSLIKQPATRLRYAGKALPIVDETGVVRQPGVLKDLTLEFSRQVLGRKVRQIPQPEEWLNVHLPQMEARANLLQKIVERAGDQAPKNPGEAGFVGEASTTPKFAYRVRDVGEKGVPNDSHAQFTTSVDEARSYADSRSKLTGKSQELVRVDLNKLEDSDYTAKFGPNGNDWIKLNRSLSESELQQGRLSPEAGVGGLPIMGSQAAGMATGAAIGAHVAGTPGALVGGALGYVAGTVAPALLAHPIVRSVLNSLGTEIRDLGYTVGSGVKDIATDLTHFLAPKLGVSSEAQTVLYTMKGDLARASWDSSRLLDTYRQHVESLPKAAQIDFIDRMKTGATQVTPELEELAKSIRAIDQEDYNAIQQYRPGLPFLDNHFRLLYKTLPGVTDDGFKGWLGKRPLQGSKGMLNQHVYDTLSDAMENGGEPITTNPIDMFLMGHVDAQRFVHAQAMWDQAKTLGLRDFVKMGDKAPDGFTKLDDRISQVYFPAASGEGLINSGTHYVEEGFGRLLNNYLSRDYVRGNVLGKTIVDIKNASTGWELAGPFHAVAINLATTSGNFALGIERAFNLGLRNADMTEFVKGAKQMVKSPVDLLTGNRSTYMDGKLIQDFGDALNRFKNGDPRALGDFSGSDKGQKFLRQYPDAEGLLGDAFQGGLNMKMSDDVRSNIVKTMQENFRNNEFIHGTARLPGAALQKLMSPLFDTYIPRIKLGMFLKDMSLQLKENASDIVSGNMTREELSRKVVDRVENTFGEMNFDNLFWNRTFKTSMQLLYRSVSWRLGTLRLLGDAIKNQGSNILEGAKAGEIPKLDPNFGYLVGETLVTGAIAAVTMKLLANKNPQNVTDLLHPQTGDVDNKGKPLRVNIPAYMSRDIPNIVSSPTGPIKYAFGGNSAIMQRAFESWNNKDFAGRWVANPNDPDYKQFAAKIYHLLPDWMMGATMDRLDAEGASKDRKALAMFGFSPAPKSIDMSPAELLAQQKMIATLPQGGRDPQSVAKSQALNQVITSIRNHRGDTGQLISDFVKQGTISANDMPRLKDGLTTPFLTRTLKSNNIKLDDVISVYQVATPEEKKELLPILANKTRELVKLPADHRGATIQKLQQIFSTQQTPQAATSGAQ